MWARNTSWWRWVRLTSAMLGGGFVLQRFVLGPINTNTYVVTDPDGRVAVVIDPAPGASDALTPILKGFEGKVIILITHAHFDHASDAARLRASLGGPPKAICVLHELDKSMYRISEGAARWFGTEWEDPVVDVYLTVREGVEPVKPLREEGVAALAIHVPGHTPGSVTYYFLDARAAFTGDTLFRGTIGRTDFPGGDPEAMRKSLRRLARELPPETRILPGHGSPTTMGRELRENDALKQALERDES